MRLEEVDLLDLDRLRRQEHHEMFRVLPAEDPDTGYQPRRK